MRFATVQRGLCWGVTLLLVLYAGNYFLTPDIVGVTRLEEFYRPQGKQKFDSEKWKRVGAATGQRYEMVDDLLATGMLVGLDAGQVETLLGKADLVGDDRGQKQLIYLLGDQRMHPAKSVLFPRVFANLDRWMLKVQFQGGRVELVRVFFT